MSILCIQFYFLFFWNYIIITIIKSNENKIKSQEYL